MVICSVLHLCGFGSPMIPPGQLFWCRSAATVDRLNEKFVKVSKHTQDQCCIVLFVVNVCFGFDIG